MLVVIQRIELNVTAAASRPNDKGEYVPYLAKSVTPNATFDEWTIGLRDGVTFQDGSPITCADIAYGVSRTFATDVITGGPTYAISMLDIPKADDGSSIYKGPYVEDAAGLTKVLTQLASNEIAGGDVKYRSIGTEAYTTLSLMDHLQGFNFTLPSFNIDIEKAPTGLEVLFEYYDRHDNRYQTGGKILWVTDDGT